MTKEVNLAELADYIVEHLEEIRQGTSLRVLDGGKTIVTLTAVEENKGKPYPFRDLPPPPPAREGAADDAIAWLIEERERDRSGKKYE